MSLKDILNDQLAPSINELPSEYSDRLGEFYSKKSTSEEKKDKGQFFTPMKIAKFMSSLSDCTKEEINILDPGSGSGVLACSLIEFLIINHNNIRKIRLDVYETDIKLIPFLEKSIEYLAKWLIDKNLQFHYQIHNTDFILQNEKQIKTSLSLFNQIEEKFDIIISNPPYFKLPKEDKRAKAAKGAVNGNSNIYSIFMAIASSMLNEGGQLIFITPRSFSSGNYFQLFRSFFFNRVDIIQVHLFHSRKETFSKDNVLQETLILKCSQKNRSKPELVTISSSNGTIDLQNPDIVQIPSELVMDYNSFDKILYLPTNKSEQKIVELFKSWSGSLNKYNIQISTGPVVAFRAWDFISESGSLDDENTAPLFWLHNVKKMELVWPIEKSNKGQYISVKPKTISILVPNKNYLLLRRFSSKDDNSRLIAAPYFCNATKSKFIGIENKLNYIYRPNNHLERSEIVGLGALLNSQIFDHFFRILNGNVNVSSTELRLIPLPPHDVIKEIGNILILHNSYNIELINRVVNEKLHV